MQDKSLPPFSSIFTYISNLYTSASTDFKRAIPVHDEHTCLFLGGDGKEIISLWLPNKIEAICDYR